MVKSDRPLGPTRSVRELVLEVPGKEGEIFEDGPRRVWRWNRAAAGC